MPDSTVLAIDAGTQSVRAILIDTNQRPVFTATEKLQLTRPTQNHVEQNPEAILNAVKAVITKAINCNIHIKTAGLATQRSTVVAWNRKTGKALGPALSWQDTRCADRIKSLHQYTTEIKIRSGLVLSPHYGASKLSWLLNEYTNNSKIAADELCIGPLASFLLFHLLEHRPYITDESNAARTQLWNLQERCWDERLCAIFNIPVHILPKCQPTQYNYGFINATGIPLTAVSGDQNAALFGVGKLPAKTALINMGTGAFILMPNHQTQYHPQLLTGLASSTTDKAHYLLEATVNGAGSALQWAIENWQINQLETKLPKWLLEVTKPPVFLNTIGGLGSPWWTSGLKPSFIGDTDQEHAIPSYAVAIIESLVFMLENNIRLIENTLNLKLQQCYVSGGLAKLNGLCQKLADLTQMPIQKLTTTETTAIGIARLAAPMRNYQPETESVFTPTTNQALKERSRQFQNGINELIINNIE